MALHHSLVVVELTQSIMIIFNDGQLYFRLHKSLLKIQENGRKIYKFKRKKKIELELTNVDCVKFGWKLS